MDNFTYALSAMVNATKNWNVTCPIRLPDINKVIFNGPATIVFWGDGTKTVVKACEGDTYDPEKGLAMAICKKALGNKGNYRKVFKRWLKGTWEEGMVVLV